MNTSKLYKISTLLKDILQSLFKYTLWSPAKTGPFPETILESFMLLNYGMRITPTAYWGKPFLRG